MARIALLSLVLVGLTVPSVTLAAHQSDVVNMKLGAWKKSGDVSIVQGDVVLHADAGETAHVWQDVNVSSMSGRYVAFAAYTKAEEVRSGTIAGLPVLYAMALDRHGKVLEYFQQPEMTFNAAAGKWDVSSGVFQIPQSAKTLRIVMQQATKRGSAMRGSDATFRMPAVAVVKDKQTAERMVKTFIVGLPRS